MQVIKSCTIKLVLFDCFHLVIQSHMPICSFITRLKQLKITAFYMCINFYYLLKISKSPLCLFVFRQFFIQMV